MLIYELISLKSEDTVTSHWNVADNYFNAVGNPRTIHAYHSTGKTSNINMLIIYI